MDFEEIDKPYKILSDDEIDDENLTRYKKFGVPNA